MAIYIFGLFKANNIIKKYSDKYGIIYLNGIWYCKKIFILLTKIIIVYMRFSQIYFQEFSFKKAFLWLCLGLSLCQFYESFQ